MLDTTTKRRIDSARDILVGKIPDPKSQVEQITIALIYKFMEDMDLQSELFGGERAFFSEEFERYSWSKLVRSNLGGHEVLGLYAEAIQKIPQNPNIPELFRSIFRNAFLPYQDPETLRAFLKIIDEFEYDHSERLGDAFEYLLSVLGSQGDAGQFRTPRHIIDFIVEVVNPQKTDVILDPACGTAGFLISAYKHILRQNSDNPDTDQPTGNMLSPHDQEILAKNIRGYDISPDMVRLSLVNMYLHGFPDPKIVEYDTLTSEDRWNEYADVVLANPPFMSPKGGIRPHSRFSITSKRSEVLFVDYILEHLNSGGRAGVIVPEGIIFQSQSAYKNLRKLLVEEALLAVISLPAGVFNPYSGVKTSVLILDKSLAKKSASIGFFRVDHDGYSLGAQRREGGPNNLPTVLEQFQEFRERVMSGDPVPDLGLSHGIVVEKATIAANEDYNLSGERYRSVVKSVSTFPMVCLGELLRLEFGTRITKREHEGTIYPVYGGGGESFRTDTYTRENDVVISRFAMSEECVREVNGKFFLLDSGFTFSISPHFDSSVLKSYVVHVLLHKQSDIYACGRGHAQKNMDINAFKALEIPIPPLAVQREIIAEIEGFQRVIDGARTVVENYRPHIPTEPSWLVMELGEIADLQYGYTASAEESGDTRFIRITDIMPNGSLNPNEPRFISLTEDARSSLLERDDILVARTGATFGKTMIFDSEAQSVFASFLIRIRFRPDTVLPRFYWAFAQSNQYWKQANALVTGGGQPQFNANAIKRIRVPVPPIDTQRELVAEIETDQQVVNANSLLINRMQQKVDSTVARVWGEAPVSI